jgi:KDO2-lipid IV(A) lauroyltransferase
MCPIKLCHLHHEGKSDFMSRPEPNKGERMQTAEKMEYLSTRTLLALCRILPASGIYVLFDLFGRAFYYLSSRRRRITLQNLAMAFPEKPSREHNRMARRTYRNLAESLAFSALMLSGKIRERDLDGYVADEQFKEIEELVHNSTTGLLFLTAHLGNWELLAHYIHYRLGGTSHVIARESDNKLIDDNILTPFRSKTGLKIIYKKQAMLKVVKALKRGEHVGILVDQKSNSHEGALVSLFGREVHAVAAPAVLQIRFNVPVVPVFMVKTGRRRYSLEIGRPVEWRDNSNPEEDQIRELTQKHDGNNGIGEREESDEACTDC